jgi:hypothetical protein
MLVTVPFEIFANHTGVYVYYGNQPLRIVEYPVWWAPVNIAMPIVAATAIHLARRSLVGWRILAVFPIVLMADGGVNGATAWPAWIVLNTPGLPNVVVQLGGVLTIAFAVLLVWLVTRPSLHAAVASAVTSAELPGVWRYAQAGSRACVTPTV